MNPNQKTYYCAVCKKHTTCYKIDMLYKDDYLYFKNHLNLKSHDAVCLDCVQKGEIERTSSGYEYIPEGANRSILS